VACLVGKNESGKTSILHALAKLNSADASLANFDKERDYPRHMLAEFDEEKQVLGGKGSVPGPRNTPVVVQEAIKK